MAEEPCRGAHKLPNPELLKQAELCKAGQRCQNFGDYRLLHVCTFGIVKTKIQWANGAMLTRKRLDHKRQNILLQTSWAYMRRDVYDTREKRVPKKPITIVRDHVAEQYIIGLLPAGGYAGAWRILKDGALDSRSLID